MAEPSPILLTLKREIEMDKVVCRFYVIGQCEDGDKCLFPHVPREGRYMDSACRYFLKNKCHFGKMCALDHVNITDKNDKKVVQIVQHQYGTRKRELEAQNFQVRACSSPNTDQHVDLVNELREYLASSVLSTKSEAENFNIPGPSKPYANEKCLTVGAVIPNIKYEKQKMYEASPTENNLQNFFRGKTLQKSSSDTSSSSVECENSQSSWSGSTQSVSEIDLDEASSSGESESKDLQIWETSQNLIQNLLMKRSEGKRRSTSGYSKDRISNGTFAAEKRSEAAGSSAASKKPVVVFDQNKPMVLYNTVIIPKGWTAEEIALYGHIALLPVDSKSRVPLYMRGATPREDIGKQTENGKKLEENNFSKQVENSKKVKGKVASKLTENTMKVEENIACKQTGSAKKVEENIASKETENTKKGEENIASKQSGNAKTVDENIASKQSGNAKTVDENIACKQTENNSKSEENNGVSQQLISEGGYIYTPSGRRVGLVRPYSPYLSSQEKI